MKILSFFLVALLFALLIVCHQADGQVHFVKDINRTPKSGIAYSAKPVHSGAYTYFIATTWELGTELWRTDGTEAGTLLVKDISPGPGSSEPSQLTDVNGTLFFIAYDPNEGTTLWKTDGTESGTVAIDGNANGLFNANGTLYYHAIVNGERGLVKYDHANGVVPVLVPGPRPSNWIHANGTTFFFDREGAKLWKTDGTTTGTTVVKDIHQLLDQNGNHPGFAPVAVGNTIYFSGSTDAGFNEELWKSDGTAAGTVMIKDIAPFGFSGAPMRLTVMNNVVYFTAYSIDPVTGATYGIELWRTDGSAGGTSMVKDINPGLNSGFFVTDGTLPMVTLNGSLIFAADDGVNGLELWKSDGTAQGTVMISDIIPGITPGMPQEITVVNDVAYFTVLNGERELWRTDGTTAGTYVLKDINTDGSGSPVAFMNDNDRLYFFADDGVHGKELWKSDGATNTTSIVKDIDAGSRSSEPAGFVTSNGIAYFSADDGENGVELWRSDGTAGGTRMVKDIAESIFDSDPVVIGEIDGTVYFFAENFMTSENELWKTNGSEAGTLRISPETIGELDNPVIVGTKIYFAATDNNGNELWVYDSTTGEIRIVKDIAAGANGSIPMKLTPVGDVLYFTADAQDGKGRELWKCDNGTASGTVMVKDIDGQGNGNPDLLQSVNGKLYFIAFDTQHGVELWESDGTAVGTHIVSDIEEGERGSYPESFATDGNKLYFHTYKNGIWVIDGDGLRLAKPTHIEGTLVYPTVVDGIFYFALHEFNEHQLWRSDGSEEGTFVIKELQTSRVSKMFSSDNKLLFIVDGVLWKSEGTLCSTVALTAQSDINITDAARSSMGDKLMLSASDNTGGLELFYYDYSNFNIGGCGQSIYGFAEISSKILGDEPFTVEAFATSELPVSFVSSDPSVAVVEGNLITLVGAGEVTISARQPGNSDYSAAPSIDQTFVVKLITGIGEAPAESVSVYPNPATDHVNVEAQIYEGSKPVLIDIQGRVIDMPVHSVDANTFQFDLARLSAGIYIVQVTTSDGRRTSNRIIKR